MYIKNRKGAWCTYVSFGSGSLIYMYIKTEKGLGALPCGTPQVICSKSETASILHRGYL